MEFDEFEDLKTWEVVKGGIFGRKWTAQALLIKDLFWEFRAVIDQMMPVVLPFVLGVFFTMLFFLPELLGWKQP